MCLEQRFVLAELIKASKPDMQPLVDFVKANCLQYSWFSMPLPNGVFLLFSRGR